MNIATKITIIYILAASIVVAGIHLASLIFNLNVGYCADIEHPATINYTKATYAVVTTQPRRELPNIRITTTHEMVYELELNTAITVNITQEESGYPIPNLRIIYTNNTDSSFMYGVYYSLMVSTKNGWMRVPGYTREGDYMRVFALIGYNFPPLSQFETFIHLYRFYGNLPSGEYLISRDFTCLEYTPPPRSFSPPPTTRIVGRFIID